MPALSSLYHSVSIQVSCMQDRRNWGEIGGSRHKWQFINIEKITEIDTRKSIVPISEFLDPPSPWHAYYHLPGHATFRKLRIAKTCQAM